jgi:diacylglycerol kinase family enzyme
LKILLKLRAVTRNFLFVVNPKAGKRKKKTFQELLIQHFPSNFNKQVVMWEPIEKFQEITQLIHSAQFTDVIAVGGDGTVNRVAVEAMKAGVRFGIVPMGSGNGLARSLGLPMDTPASLQAIANGREQMIDAGMAGYEVFFCTSGVGFDALIGEQFANSRERGFWSYVKIIFRELFSYEPESYSLQFNNMTVPVEAFLVTAANAGQYGNNFYIAPKASMQDGLMHVVVLKKFPPLAIIGLLIKILRRKADQSKYIDTYTTDKLLIIRDHSGAMHYDGEPGNAGRTIQFEIKPKALKVIVGSQFNG